MTALRLCETKTGAQGLFLKSAPFAPPETSAFWGRKSYCDPGDLTLENVSDLYLLSCTGLCPRHLPFDVRFPNMQASDAHDRVLKRHFRVLQAAGQLENGG